MQREKESGEDIKKMRKGERGKEYFVMCLSLKLLNKAISQRLALKCMLHPKVN